MIKPTATLLDVELYRPTASNDSASGYKGRLGIFEVLSVDESIKDLITPKTKDVFVAQGIKEALEKAMSQAKPSDLVLVTGSLYVVGEAREILVKDEL